MAYSPRLTCPSNSSKYYNSNSNPFVQAGYGMFQNNGNCTAYAWGRFFELLNKSPRLWTGNAEDWYKHTEDGYQRGQTPKLGAIAVWEGIGSLAGHVAVVEEIKNGIVTFSNSGWRYKYFYLTKMSAPYNIGSSYKFLGFIYNPNNYDNNPQPQPPKPTPQIFKFNVGDKVTFTGILYSDAKGNGAGQSRNNLVATITKRAEGSKPYNLNNGLGWVAEADLKKYVAPTPTGLKVGDTVKIIGYGNSQSDGKGLTSGGIGWTRTVIRIANGTKNPYCIGSGNIATGWYPQSSLKKM